MTAEVANNRVQGSGSRIPLALQAVFIASNRGKDVDKPPPEKAAHRTYFRSWVFKGLGKMKKKAKNSGGKNGKNKHGRPPTVVQFGAKKDSPELISTQPEPAAEPKAPPSRKTKVCIAVAVFIAHTVAIVSFPVSRVLSHQRRHIHKTAIHPPAYVTTSLLGCPDSCQGILHSSIQNITDRLLLQTNSFSTSQLQRLPRQTCPVQRRQKATIRYPSRNISESL